LEAKMAGGCGKKKQRPIKTIRKSNKKKYGKKK